MDRDFIGYGAECPKVAWPLGAHIAVNFVINYEEGGELNILDGDDESESYLTDLPQVTALKGERHLSVESLFEYGSRAGVWRLMRLFDEFEVPITVFATGFALERNVNFAKKLKESPHEVAGHGYRWVNYRTLSEEAEREHIRKTVSLIQTLTQKKVKGWYTGRRSAHTRQLIVEEGLLYDSESYADDLPYWVRVPELKKTHLIIPYDLNTNDARYALTPGWNSGEDFFQYLKASFDCLYREGKEFPKMMTIGLHARLSGRPGRSEALRRFIEYVKSHNNVWICRREDIAELWYNHYCF